MTAIADVSGDLSALWPWYVWAFGIVLLIGGWWLVLANNAPLTDPEPSALDQRDGISSHCTEPDCHEPAWVAIHDGKRARPVCRDCFKDGARANRWAAWSRGVAS